MATETLDRELEAIQRKARERIEAILRTHASEENTTTEEERNNALALAMSIARRAGLELYKIQQELKRDSRFITQRVDLLGHGNWRLQLAYALRDALIVSVIKHRTIVETTPNKRTGNTTRHPRADYISVTGIKSDVEIFEYLYVFITRQLVKAADAAYASARASAADDFKQTFTDVNLGTRMGALRLRAWMPQGKAFRDAFYRGAVETLYGRLREMFQEQHADLTPSDVETMALIPLKQADVQAAEKEAFPNAVYKKGPSIWTVQKSSHRLTTETDDVMARMAGREAGERLDLRKGITEGFSGALPAPDGD